MKKYRIIGLMSGSSLDGLDIACVDFQISNSEHFDVKYQLVAADTIPFSETWITQLKQLTTANAIDFCKANAHFGHYIGKLTNDFIEKYLDHKPDYIASHGHTIFHYPSEKFTVQIGDGAAIAAITGISVISDFRTKDIALGGQGAPIAPIADKYLLPNHDFYVNLGGIANISCAIANKFIAFDTSAANQVLNVLANIIGLAYDDEGKIAATGTVNDELLNRVNSVEYHQFRYPKSLDNTWVQQEITPLYLLSECSLADKLATATEQTAMQLALAIQQIIDQESFHQSSYSMIITGGGALNSFLLDRIKIQLKNHGLGHVNLVLPNLQMIQFKEALLIALVGLLRIEQIPNSMATVTGASSDAVNGAIYF